MTFDQIYITDWKWIKNILYSQVSYFIREIKQNLET